MAGGPFADVIVCDLCRDAVRPAQRVYEGSEDDTYRCALGHSFGVHWRQLPDRPMWPRPDHEAVRDQAYVRWQGRQAGGVGGDADGDWYAAEQDLLRVLVGRG